MARTRFNRIRSARHLDDAVLNQANPVQNTWYTALDTILNGRIRTLVYGIEGADETIEVRVTIDGVTKTSSVACTDGATYTPTHWGLTQNVFGGTSTVNNVYSWQLEGRSIKIELRKTTALASTALKAKIVYEQW